jgi:uncharacterized membrane protein HdeD (DUF308 family)
MAIPRASTLVPWWLILLQGIASLLLGLMLLGAPGATMLVLAQLLGTYWLVSGLFGIVALFVDNRYWLWKLLVGLLGVLAGIAVLQHPVWSAVLIPTLLVVLLGIQGMINGAIELALAFAAKDWGLGILGVVSILLGVALLANPVLGALALPPLLGVLALVGGAIAIVMAVRAR